MRYIIRSFLIAFILFISIFSYAKANQNKAVLIYAKPNQKSQVIERLKSAQTLVPIFHKKDWLKVGNPQNGKVGWLYTKDKKSPMVMVHAPMMQSLYITSTGKPGKEQIVAYKNGKKLDSKDAKKMYEKIQKRQQKMNEQYRKMQHQMDAQFAASMRQYHQMMKMMNDDAWSMHQPVIVVMPGQ